jgi:NTP pyrophosphatase (non-canonical NTP hydrolase)
MWAAITDPPAYAQMARAIRHLRDGAAPDDRPSEEREADRQRRAVNRSVERQQEEMAPTEYYEDHDEPEPDEPPTRYRAVYQPVETSGPITWGGTWIHAVNADGTVTRREDIPAPPPRPQPGVSSLEDDVRRLISLNATHISTGTRMSDVSWDTLFGHLTTEVNEAAAAIHDNDEDNIIHELGDVLGIVVHAIIKAGYSVQDAVDAEREKLRQRFHADEPF